MKPPIADRIRTPTLIPSIVVSVIVVGGTFALGPLMKVTRPDDWCAVFVYWCFGTTAAGGGVVAVWSSLGLGPFIIREAVGLGLALLLAISGVMGALLAGERFDDDFIGPLLSVPAIFLAVQLPLLLLRFAYGWRLELIGRPEWTARGPVTIRGMMIATAVVALALTMARGAVAVAGEGSSFWGVLGIAAASIAGSSLIGAVPTVYFMLRLRNVSLGIGLQTAYAVALAATLWIALWVLSEVFSGRGWLPPVWNMMGVVITIFACSGTLSAAMASLRLLGFRLTCPDKDSTEQLSKPIGGNGRCQDALV